MILIRVDRLQSRKELEGLFFFSVVTEIDIYIPSIVVDLIESKLKRWNKLRFLNECYLQVLQAQHLDHL